MAINARFNPNERSSYVVIHTVDVLGDEEWLVIPQPTMSELEAVDSDPAPLWFDSDVAWTVDDFTNPAIYASVDITYVEL